MTEVPESPKPFISTVKSKTIYCFPPGNSEADKQHDIAQVDKFIEHIKAKRKKK